MFVVKNLKPYLRYKDTIKNLNDITIAKEFWFFTSLVNRFYLLVCQGTCIFALFF